MYNSMLDSKKSSISPYTRRLLIQHSGYAVILVLFLALLFTFVPFQITSYSKTRSQLVKMEKEVDELSARLAAIEEYPSNDLEDLVLSLNSLYPSEEDRFSIFASLDNLKKITAINIHSYSSPFSGKAYEEVDVSVKAHADLPTFRRFLKDHVYKSGRFMTLSQISFSDEKKSLSFTATFHSKKVNLKSKKPVEIKPDLIQRAMDIRLEVESSGLVKKNVSEGASTSPVDYSTNPNPFE